MIAPLTQRIAEHKGNLTTLEDALVILIGACVMAFVTIILLYIYEKMP